MSYPGFIQRLCTQTAVYWGTPVNNGYGSYTYATPTEIKCHWHSVKKLMFSRGKLYDNGELEITNAQVIVLQNLEWNGWLYLGTLNDFASGTDLSNPKNIDGAYQIKQIVDEPFVRSKSKFVKTVYV